MRKSIVGIALIMSLLVFAGCQKKDTPAAPTTPKTTEPVVETTEASSVATEVPTEEVKTTEPQEIEIAYNMMTMDEAKELFQDIDGSYVIVDVRRADEFAEGHIPGAINIANEDINNAMPSELPDKEQTIYVYCRSGRRSKEAAEKLVNLGYTHVVEFGGILDWTGEIEK